MIPEAHRSSEPRESIRFAVDECWLGALLVAATSKGVCSIDIGQDPKTLVYELADRFPRAELVGGDAKIDRLLARVAALIEKPGGGLRLALDIRGTAFQLRVWEAIRAIPPGATASYAEIARRIGQPRAARAVAGACGCCHLSVAIPCHRVVRADGSLSGTRRGIEVRRALLKREGTG